MIATKTGHALERGSQVHFVAEFKELRDYLHHGRLLTLEDSVEFFNLILETKLTALEKTDLVAFLRAL